MGQGISEILTFSVGVAISPVPIIAVTLMLFSQRARVNGPASWWAGLPRSPLSAASPTSSPTRPTPAPTAPPSTRSPEARSSSAPCSCCSPSAAGVTARRPAPGPTCRRGWPASTPSQAPNVLWATDIKQIETHEGRLYLAAVQDLFSRRIVGWAMEQHLRHQLVVDALKMAVRARRPDRGLIHHSEQGSQFVSLAFGKTCVENGIAKSMGSRACGRRSSPTSRAGTTAGEVASIGPAISRREWRDRHDPRLAACAHALGYRGRCLTKSRRYSTTFKALREAREAWVHAQNLARSTDATQRAIAAGETRAASWRCVGTPHVTAADAFLAASAAARAREHRRLARKAFAVEVNRGGVR